MGKKKKKEPVVEYNRIKDVLQSKDISQTDLAKHLNLTFVAVTRYVNNHQQPTIKTLFEIAEFLKVEPSELLLKKKK